MKHKIALTLAALSLFVSACGNDAATLTTDAVAQPVPPAVTGAGFPAQIQHDTGVTEVAARPGRIAALSGTHIETLFAIGAGSQVVAGDLFSNYPPEAVESLELVDSFNLSVESVIDLNPDLVVLSYDPGGAVAAFEAVGIPTLLFGTAGTLDDVYDQIIAVGRAAGFETQARSLVDEMSTAVAEIMATSSAGTSGVTFYHESDPFGYYTPNSSSFIGGLYALLGMVNIADAAPDEFDSGFPALSAEFIVASDPDIVYLAGFGETPETLAQRDGWGTLTALEAGSVVVLDYDTSSRWGPRVVDLLRAIAEGATTMTDG